MHTPSPGPRGRRREDLRFHERRAGERRADFSTAAGLRRSQATARARTENIPYGPDPEGPVPLTPEQAQAIQNRYQRYRRVSRRLGYSHDWKDGPRPPNKMRVHLFGRRRGSANLIRQPDQTRRLPRAGPDQRRTDLIMPKRRGYSGRGSYGGGVSSAYIRQKFPKATHGRVYVPRGQTQTRGSAYFKYGPSWAEASDDQRSARLADGFRGRGGYIGRALGGFAGGKVGLAGAGAAIGDKAGDWLWGKTKGLLGMGLYEGQGAYTSANSLVAGSGRSPPRFGSIQDETGALIVSHREYVGDVFGPPSTKRNFKNRVYDLNPGVESSFPWLSQIAQNYEEYEFGQLVYEFKSSVNPSVAGEGQMGTIVMATNYNAGSRPFDDKATMMHYDGSQSCRSTQNAVHGIECDPSKISGAAGHYIRTGPMPDEDVKSYDHGKFQLATVGMPDNFDDHPIGELWVYYTVKLRKPRLYSARGLNLSRDVFCLNQEHSRSTQCFDGAPWAAHASNSLGCKLDFETANKMGEAVNIAGRWKITFPAAYAGNLELRMMCAGNLHETYVQSNMASTSGEHTQLMNLGFAKIIDDGSAASLDRELELDLPVGTGGGTGNITLIKDMFGIYPGTHSSAYPSTPLAPAGITVCGAATGSDGRHDMIMAVCHIKVGVATDGNDNSLIFTVPRVDATNGQVLQTVLEVVEYNTFDADPVNSPEGSWVNHGTGVAVDPKTLTGF